MAGRWCPWERLEISTGLWSYKWRDCLGSRTLIAISGNDMDLGCNAGSCAAIPPTTTPLDPQTGIEDEPFSVSSHGLTGPLKLSDKSTGELGKLRSVSTSVAEIPNQDRFVRIHTFSLDESQNKNGERVPGGTFRLAVEIEKSEWQEAGASAQINVVPAVSKHGYVENYLLLKPADQDYVIPTILRSAP